LSVLGAYRQGKDIALLPFSGGLTPEEAAAEFSTLLAPSYTRELRNFRRLVRRVESFYKKEPETRFSVRPSQAPDLFTEIIAGAVVELAARQTESRQQKAALILRRHCSSRVGNAT
jgi:hypothetical protein